ncbi:MAG: CdaR family protein [Candidatus Promineifilaceae bacterium]|nr:CdaR family protein [Candidatus Promineifilaceae bacterium]
MLRIFTSLAANMATFLLALILAVAIWVFAIGEADPVDQRRLSGIPVQVVGRPANSEVSGIPSTVEVQLEGPTSVLDDLTVDDFTVEVDLAGAPVGTSEVPVRLEHELDTVNVVWQSAENVLVTIEPIISRQVPVRVEIRGNVARGYERGPVLVEPEAISVTGIASRVEQLAEARTTIFLDSPQEDLVVTRRPIFYDLQGNIVSGANLEVNSEEIEIFIPVEQLVGFAAIPIFVDWEGEPAPGYRLLDVNVEPDSVLVTGDRELLDDLRRIRTQPVDITGLRESQTMAVGLDLPEGVELDEVQPVVVRVEIEPILTSSIIRKQPEIRALAEGLTVTTGLSEVRVFLFGPIDKLDSLTEEDVRVTLDLFNLGVGEHTLEPDADVFVSDIEVRSLQPAQLTVNVTRTMTTEEMTRTQALSAVPLGEGVTPSGGVGALAGLTGIIGLLAGLIPAALVIVKKEKQTWVVKH